MALPDPLKKLARLYNLQTVYRDGFGQLRSAPREAILAVLQSLGAPLNSFDDLPDALRRRRQELWQTVIEPVLIAWQGQPLSFKMRLPQRLADSQVRYQIILETGALLEGGCAETPARRVHALEIDGAHYVERSLIVPAPLPVGYHHLRLSLASLNVESAVISAPAQSYGLPDSKAWGIFCPLYALNSSRSWGAGDYTDLVTFARFVGEFKGKAVATLPMLASFLDEPFNPSPYAPVSRLFWNEFYLDISTIPEFAQCPTAQAKVNSAEFQLRLTDARALSLVDYQKIMALKREVIGELVKFLFARDCARRTSLFEYTTSHPTVCDYAAFRAKVERHRSVWFEWPQIARGGKLSVGDYDEDAYRYHLYVQWLCAEQMQQLREHVNQQGVSLYLDFPLGVNRDGYDVWRGQNLFALTANGGAPPDALFQKGQNWGFPPFHPDAMRSDGYRYYIECLRHHMRAAGMLRIDHIMGLHRAFWVPDGFGAANGLYVHHRGEEYYAILSLESHRHQVQVVGENLGTVPSYVNEVMVRRNVLGMHVGIFSVKANVEQAIEEAPANTVASLNTHDTATFMGFWSGADIQDRISLGLLAEAEAAHEQQLRADQRAALVQFLRNRGWLGNNGDDPASVLKAWLSFLASNDESFLLVNLEDLWLEAAPQNTPGTWQERPNWQRKADRSLEATREAADIAQVLETISDIRGSMR